MVHGKCVQKILFRKTEFFLSEKNRDVVNLCGAAQTLSDNKLE